MGQAEEPRLPLRSPLPPVTLRRAPNRVPACSVCAAVACRCTPCVPTWSPVRVCLACPPRITPRAPSVRPLCAPPKGHATPTRTHTGAPLVVGSGRGRPGIPRLKPRRRSAAAEAGGCPTLRPPVGPVQ